MWNLFKVHDAMTPKPKYTANTTLSKYTLKTSISFGPLRLYANDTASSAFPAPPLCRRSNTGWLGWVRQDKPHQTIDSGDEARL